MKNSILGTDSYKFGHSQDYNTNAYIQMKAVFTTQFQLMAPPENAIEEMRDAFDNALDDFVDEWFSVEDEPEGPEAA